MPVFMLVLVTCYFQSE